MTEAGTQQGQDPGNRNSGRCQCTVCRHLHPRVFFPRLVRCHTITPMGPSECGMTSHGLISSSRRIPFPCGSLGSLTNSHHDVNDTSENQDQRDDLAEAPGTFARLDIWTIALDLKFASVCFR